MNSEYYYNQIKDHVLEVVEKGSKVQVYKLRKPEGGSMMSTILVFLPSVIIITGDLRVADHGVQAIGYGIEWFSRKLEPTYLAEKFLNTQWVPEHAKDYFRAALAYWNEKISEYEQHWEDFEEYDEPELQKRDWKVAGEELENVTIIEALEKLLEDEYGETFSDPNTLYAALPAYKEKKPDLVTTPFISHYHCPFSTDGGLGGYGYPDHEVGWLGAINRRFSELYRGDL